MDWATVANLIVDIGMPAVERLISLWETKQAVTSAEFANLQSLANQTAQDRMKARLTAAGIDLNSDQAKVLLGLTDAPPNLSVATPPQSPS